MNQFTRPSPDSIFIAGFDKYDPKRKKVDKTSVNSNTKVRLLEDSTNTELPPHVLKLVGQRNDTPLETLGCLVLATALESGFIPTPAKYDGPIASPHCIYYSKVTVKHAVQPPLFFQMYGCMKASIQAICCPFNPCLLLMIPCGDALIVSLTTQDSYGRSIYLPLDKYLPIRDISIALPQRLRNMKVLSRKLKDGLFTPVRDQCCITFQVSFPGLLGLPPEIFAIIFDKLDKRSKLNLMSTCMRALQLRAGF